MFLPGSRQGRGPGVCVTHVCALLLCLADRLPACGGRYSSGGGLLLGQPAGVRDQQGRGDVHEESGEGQPGPGERLRDDGGEALVPRRVPGPGRECLLLLAPLVTLSEFSPSMPLTPGLEQGEHLVSAGWPPT